MAEDVSIGRGVLALVADDSGLRQTFGEIRQSAQSLGRDLQQATGVPVTFPGLDRIGNQFRDAEVGARGYNSALERFAGIDVVDKANSYASAVSAIGGANKLTASEQQEVNRAVTDGIAKYTALGRDVPPELSKLAGETARTGRETGLLTGLAGQLGGVLTGVAIVGAVKTFTDMAGRVADLSARMGLSYEAAQKFDFALQQNGSSLEAMASANDVLVKKMAQGKDSFVGALSDVGLSLDQIRNMNAEQRFLAIADGIRAVEDPTRQSQLALELLGRSGSQMLPTLTSDMRALGEQAEATGAVMSDSMIESGDALGDSWDALLTVGKSLLGAVLTPIAPLLRVVADAVAYAAGKFGEFVKYAQDTLFPFQKAIELFQILKGELGDPQFSKPPALFTDFPKLVGTDWKVALEAADEAFGKNNESIKKHIEAVDKDREAAKKLSDQLGGLGLAKELNDLERAWRNQPPEIKNNELAIERLLKQYEPYRTQVGINALPADLERVRLGHSNLGVAMNRLSTTELPTVIGMTREERDALNELVPSKTFSDLDTLTRTKLPALDSQFDSSAFMAEQAAARAREAWGNIPSQFESLRTAISGEFAQMLIGAESFKEGWTGIWNSIKATALNIFNEILERFITGLLGGMMDALLGRQGAFGNLFGGLFGGGGFGGLFGGGGGGLLPGLFGGGAGAGLPGTAVGVESGAGIAGIGGGGTGAGAAGIAAGAAGAAGAAAAGWFIGDWMQRWFGQGWGTALGAGGGAAAGAAIGSIVPGIGTAVGAIIGGLFGGAGGLFGRDEESRRVNPARDSFLRLFERNPGDNGFNILASELSRITGQGGGGDLFRALLQADTMREFEAAVRAIEQAFRDEQSAAEDAGAATSDAVQTDPVDQFTDSITTASSNVDSFTSAIQLVGNESTVTGQKSEAAFEGIAATTNEVRQSQIQLIAQMKMAGTEGKQAGFVASGGLNQIVDSAEDVSDELLNIPWSEMADIAVTELQRVRREIDGISFGSSPGGIKEWPIQLEKGLKAMRDFELGAASALRAVRNEVDTVFGGTTAGGSAHHPIELHVVHKTEDGRVLKRETVRVGRDHEPLTIHMLKHDIEGARSRTLDAMGRR